MAEGEARSPIAGVAMFRYFFNVHDDVAHVNTIGMMLPDIGAAYAKGLILAGELIREAGIEGRIGDDWYLQITDEMGLVMFRMDFIVVPSAAASWNAPFR